MSKAKKATKKFNQKKAKGSVQFKRKPNFHKKHGGGKHDGKPPSGAAAAADDDQQQQHAAAAKPVEEMDLDEFLDGGFEAAAGGADSADSGGSDSEEGAGDSGSDDLSVSEDDADNANMTAAGAQGSEEEEGSDVDVDAAAAAGGGGPEAAAVAADNVRLKGAVSRHKQQLEALRQKDPEFYAYLQATDAELLGFGEGDDDEEESEEEEGSEDEDSDEDDAAATAAAKGKAKKQQEKQKASKKAAAAEADDSEQEEEEAGSDDEQQQEEGEEGEEGGRKTIQVTSSLVDSWTQSALDNASLGAMMQLVKAYRVACHYGDTEAEMSTTLSITSGAVFNKVLLFMLKEADGIFRRMLGLPSDTSTAAAAAVAAMGQTAGAEAGGGSSGSKATVLLAEHITKAPRWKKIEPLVKSYLGNSLHLLSSMTQPAMTAFTLRRLRASAAFLGPFNHLAKKLMRQGIKLFGSEEAGPRLQALLLLRQMSLVLPPPMGQSVLRGAYRSYVSSAKFVSPASLPTLNFMAAGFVELSSLDLAVTYQVGFIAVRELAVLLRNALAAKTQDAHKEVYCWQTLMCLELWVKVLAAAAPRGTLQPLVYPTTQLLLGAARLVPTPRYFPIRLRLVRALNRLAQATGVYIPVSPLLLEMLQWSELRKTPTGTAAAPDLLLLLRLSKTQLKTAATQEEVVSQVLELLTEHLAQWSTSISFPELSHLPCVSLRGFAKGCAVERFRRLAKQLVDALERNAGYVGSARDNVAFAPQDLAAAAAFLSSDKERAQAPLSQYARQVLQKAADRLAMRSAAAGGTNEVQLGGGGGGNKKAAAAAAAAAGKRKRGGGDSSDDEEEEDSDAGGEAAAGGSGSGEEEEDDYEALDAAAKRMMRQKEKRLKRSGGGSAAAAAGDSDDGGSDSDGDDGAGGAAAAAAAAAGEDRVADYELSDDSEDDGAGGGGGRGWFAGSSEEEEDDSEEEEGGGGGSRKQQQGGRSQQNQQQRGRGRGGGGRGGGGGRDGGRGRGSSNGRGSSSGRDGGRGRGGGGRGRGGGGGERDSGGRGGRGGRGGGRGGRGGGGRGGPGGRGGRGRH